MPKVVLRKARARAEKTLRDLEREKERSERELLRLQAQAGDIRTRLSAFTEAAVQLLSAEAEAPEGDVSESALADLQDALRTGLPSAAGVTPATPPEAQAPTR